MLTIKQGRPTMPAMGDIGTYVRTRRLELGLTLQQLADRSGLRAQTISMIELGNRRELRMDTGVRLARGLEVSVDEFLNHMPPADTVPV